MKNITQAYFFLIVEELPLKTNQSRKWSLKRDVVAYKNLKNLRFDMFWLPEAWQSIDVWVRFIIGSGNGLSSIQHQTIIWPLCWFVVYLIFWNIIQWNFNQDTSLFIKENESGNVGYFATSQCVGNMLWKLTFATDSKYRWVSARKM